MTWTSKCRLSRTRWLASRTVAKASGSSDSSVSPFEARPELAGLTAQLLVAHRDEVVLDRIHLFGDVAELLEKFALAYAQQPIHQSHGNWLPYVVITYLHGLWRRVVPSCRSAHARLHPS